jgi:hypothetical protein
MYNSAILMSSFYLLSTFYWNVGLFSGISCYLYWEDLNLGSLYRKLCVPDRFVSFEMILICFDVTFVHEIFRCRWLMAGELCILAVIQRASIFTTLC